MSRATKRKHMLFEDLQDDFSPPTADQQIVKVLCNRGNNLHEVQTPDGSTFLVSMPMKFRRNIWIKRGDFVLVHDIKEGKKVKAEIMKVLTMQHIKYFKEDGAWPRAFTDSVKDEGNNEEVFEKGCVTSDDESSDYDSDNSIFDVSTESVISDYDSLK